MPSGRAAFLERLEVLMEMDATRVPVMRRQVEPADNEEKNPHVSLRDGMVARMADRLLYLGSSQDTEGRSTVLAVVDA